MQEQLLLSVLPVHLAFELKNKMLDKLRMGMGGTMGDINQRRSAYGKFYDLYIKVHENVRYRQQIGVTFIDRLLCSDSV